MVGDDLVEGALQFANVCLDYGGDVALDLGIEFVIALFTLGFDDGDAGF